MRRRFIKLFLISVVLLGIIFFISNFISSEIEAGGGRGTWCLESDNSWICKGDGNDCTIPK